MLCLCAAQLKFWFQTDLGRENSASCYRQGRQLLLTFLTMFTRWSRSTSNFYALIGQNLTGEFMWKIYAHFESCLLWQLKLTQFCDVFNCLFSLDVQNEIQLLSGVICFSWLVCIRFRMVSFSFSPCLMLKRVAKSEPILALLNWYLSGAASRVVSLSNYCIWCLFIYLFFINLM